MHRRKEKTTSCYPSVKKKENNVETVNNEEREYLALWVKELLSALLFVVSEVSMGFRR
jgi:hypothetical protein